MATTTLAQPAAVGADVRDWPRTTRVLPWLVALMVSVLFLAPIDSMTLPVPLPFDARPDRVLLIVCFAVWMLVVAVEAPLGRPRLRYRFGAVEVALILLAVAAVASVALHLALLQQLGESSLATKKLVLLASYIGFYLFVVGNVRPSEVPAFARLVIALGVVAALGTALQYVAHVNVFFSAASALAPPGSEIASHASILTPGGRPDITGPARHGLAISTMLAMILPLALVGAVFGGARRDRLLFTVAAVVIFVGGLATIRRAGVVLPFVGCSVVLALGGRRMLPAAAVTMVLLASLPVVAPGAIREVQAQFSSSNVGAQQSVQGRTADYPAVVPDLRAGALLGRGFGSYAAKRYRFIDNQFIVQAIETGFVGLAVYAGLLVTAAAVALRAGLRGGGSWIALAATGSVLAFAVSNALFDALAFPHAPYAFLLIVALVGVARHEDKTPGHQPG